MKPEKCSWGLLAFQWKHGKWSLHTKESFPARLSVPDEAGNLTEVTRVEPHEPVTVVGVAQSLDGSMSGQVVALRGVADQWAQGIRSGHLSRRDAWLGLKRMIWPSLKYPLTATTLTEKQGAQIMSSLYKVLVPKLGANRGFPNAYRYAPHCFHGLALPAPYLSQGAEQVISIISCGTGSDMPGYLIQASLEQAQLEIGFGTQLFAVDYAQFGHLVTDCWIKSVWEFVSRAGIQLSGYDIPIPPLQREHDQYIMEWLLERSPGLSASDLRSINRCRLFLQASSLTDIVSGDGTYILPST